MSETEKKLTEKFVEIKNSIIKSELVRVGSLVFFGLGLLLFLLPFFFNNSALKFQITQQASKILNADFAVLGDVEVAFLPSPTITLNEVLLRNYRVKSGEDLPEEVYNIYAKKTAIKMSVFNSSIKKIIFSDAVMQSYKDSVDAAVHSDKFNEIVAELTKNPPENEAKSSSGISAKLFSVAGAEFSTNKTPRIVAKNSQAIFYDSFGKKNEVAAVNAEAKFGEKKVFAAGSFVSENIVSNFKLNAKFGSSSTKPDSFLELSSAAAEIRVSGNFSAENLGLFASDFSGKLDANIADFKAFYKSYIGGNSAVADKLRAGSGSIKISADIASKAKEISIENVVINSGVIGGKGEVDLDFTTKIPAIDVRLELENLDLNALLSDESSAHFASDTTLKNSDDAANETAETLPQIVDPNAEHPKSELIESEPQKLDLNLVKKIRNFDLDAEITIANIEFLQGQVKDANIYLTISHDGEVIVSPMIFTVPGEGVFRVSGILDNSGAAPKFVGKFDASGKSLEETFRWLKIESQNLKFGNLKKYQIYSDILLVPNITKLNNFYLNLNSDNSEFLGEITIDNADKTPNIKSRFRGNNFNVDDYFFTSNRNAYFSPGLLVRKLLWLNDIVSTAEFDLSFDKLIYSGEEFLDQSVKLKFGRGYIQIDDLKLTSQKTDLSASMLVDISEKNPQFNLNVVANNFHYEAKIDPEKVTSQKFKTQNSIDQFFDLPSLEGFNGQIDAKFVSLELDGVPLENVKFGGNLRDGSIKNARLTSKIYGGDFDYQGLIGIGLNKVLSGNITFKNVSLKEFLFESFGVKNVDGLANFAANITASAATKDEFKKSLSSEIKFNINAPSVEGYGLEDLVKKMFAPQKNALELRGPEKILLNPQGLTLFKKAGGSIKFSDGVGKVSVSTSAVAINGVLTGAIDLPNNSTNLLFNTIFLTGTRQKQTPINIATNISGSLDALGQNTNMDQVRQYLSLGKAPITNDLAAPTQLKSQIVQPTSIQ
ncbi:MAG: AsmA family protein [Rickettsiales bacterium]|nr:AsmA family protein [Rickettsiales bacterium]